MWRNMNNQANFPQSKNSKIRLSCKNISATWNPIIRKSFKNCYFQIHGNEILKRKISWNILHKYLSSICVITQQPKSEYPVTQRHARLQNVRIRISRTREIFRLAVYIYIYTDEKIYMQYMPLNVITIGSLIFGTNIQFIKQ